MGPPGLVPSFHLTHPCPIEVKVVREHRGPLVPTRERDEPRDVRVRRVREHERPRRVGERRRRDQHAEVRCERVEDGLERVVLVRGPLALDDRAVPRL